MKKQFGILMLVLISFVGRAEVTNLTVTASVNAAIPDANPVGMFSSLNVAGMYTGITSLTVDLNITGGYNGNLYAYLLAPDSTMVVLLNRVGVGSVGFTDSFGYNDAGFNITLAPTGNNIHDYNNPAYGATFSAGQLTGTWMPDQRTIDPQSAASAFDAAPTGNNLSTYYGTDPNGIWTLHVSDVSGGYQSTLVSWGLTVMTVPEPQTWTLLGGGLTALLWLKRNRRK